MKATLGLCRIPEFQTRTPPIWPSSSLSIKEIAFAVGFKHVAYCNRSFAQVFGMPPREAVARFRRW